jgi:amino acid transporter
MSAVPETRAEATRGEPLVLVPAAVWIAHVASGYAIVALHCHRHFLESSVAGVESVRLVVLALTVVAAAIVVAIGLYSLGTWRRLRDDERLDPNGRQAFSHALTAAVSALALVYLLWTLAPTLFGDPCA